MSRTFEQWASSRGTDEEIAEAIFWLSGEEADQEETPKSDRIWEAPTREEWLAIWERVTGNGLRDGADYHWGESRMGNEYQG